MRRAWFEIDRWKWTFPLTIELNLVGNNSRTYNIIVSFLCFHIVFPIDEDCF